MRADLSGLIFVITKAAPVTLPRSDESLGRFSCAKLWARGRIELCSHTPVPKTGILPSSQGLSAHPTMGEVPPPLNESGIGKWLRCGINSCGVMQSKRVNIRTQWQPWVETRIGGQRILKGY
jgi:hypothetical protein